MPVDLHNLDKKKVKGLFSSALGNMWQYSYAIPRIEALLKLYPWLKDSNLYSQYKAKLKREINTTLPFVKKLVLSLEHMR